MFDLMTIAVTQSLCSRKINTCLIEIYMKESDCGLISVQVSRNLPGVTKQTHDNLKEIGDIFYRDSNRAP
jgi:hypothetical protein